MPFYSCFSDDKSHVLTIKKPNIIVIYSVESEILTQIVVSS